MSEEQFKHWRINQGGQALLDAMNIGEISASLFAKQVWQDALSSQSAKSVPEQTGSPMMRTADELLEALARDGGVIVNTSKLTEAGIAQARACGKMYVNESGLGFVILENCGAHPKSSQSSKDVLARPIDTMTGEVLWGLAKDHFKMSPVAPTEVYTFSYALADMLSSPQPTDERVRELEKDAARYRWILNNHKATDALWRLLPPEIFANNRHISNAIDQAIASMSSGEQ